MGLIGAQDVSFASMNILDVVLLAVVVYSAIRGFMQGFISEMGLLLGLVAGTIVASRVAAQVGAPLGAFGANASLRAAGGYATVLIVVWIAARLITGVLRGGAKLLLLGWVDHLAGVGFGLVRGALIAVLASFVIVHFRVGSLSALAHDSPVVHLVSPLFDTLNALLPPNLPKGPIVP